MMTIIIIIIVIIIIIILEGKTIESIESRTDTKIVRTIEQQLNVMADPYLKEIAILDDNTLLASFYKKNVDLDRPVALGTAILGKQCFKVFH